MADETDPRAEPMGRCQLARRELVNRTICKIYGDYTGGKQNNGVRHIRIVVLELWKVKRKPLKAS